MQRLALRVLTGIAVMWAAGAAQGAPQYGPGVTDTEILVGQTIPYSGPLSSYGTLGRAAAAYFEKINQEGGINGRKIRVISLDDAYSPPRTLEMTRRLVERENVLLIYAPIGTPTNSAIHRYLNNRKVPHLLVASGASKWDDQENFPWTMGLQPTYHNEGKVYAQHILKTRPQAKVAVLYQNDDFGKDYLNGFKAGLGERADMIVATASYETSDATVDSQLIGLKESGADVFFNIGSPKFAAQAIRRVGDIGWTPAHYVVNISASVGAVLKPAGLDRARGLITMMYAKQPTDAQWANDPGAQEFLAFMKKYYPEGDPTDFMNANSVLSAQTLVQILKQAGDNLTRENVMKEAANLKQFTTPLLLPGMEINTGPDDYAPIEAAQMMQFDGNEWLPMGELIGNK